jgi:S-adenosylmethionine synthetase
MLFTSESVTEGHPDKVCDQIADALLDAHLAQDPEARTAIEVVACTGLVSVMGQVTSRAQVDVQAVVRRTLREIGYVGTAGFDADSCAVLTALEGQSPDIAQGVDAALEVRRPSGLGGLPPDLWLLSNGGRGGSAVAVAEALPATELDEADRLGAGDQGMMFGYGCDETPELMPLPISLAHRLALRLSAVRRSGELPYLRPDGKTQVTVEYRDGLPERLDALVLSSQHAPEVEPERIAADLRRVVIDAVVPARWMDGDTQVYINPTGRFVVGGPQGDTGLTGRKIIVDTYGGYARHGGGAFSGKDPTKVDRSASYAARHAAKNFVAAGLCRRCEIRVAYAIGVARPIALSVDSQGTGLLPDGVLSELARELFDLRPARIIADLHLRRPIYRRVAAYGHFGRPDLDLPWEATDRIAALQAAARARGARL